MKRKLSVAVLYGGRSVEHQVSVTSAATVVGALDPARYEPIPIGITPEGRWFTGPESARLLAKASRGSLCSVTSRGSEVILLPEPTRHRLLVLEGRRARYGPRVDVVFPLVHGSGGEDGTLQGLLELAGVPYVGAGVAASAVGMDKALMKSLFRDAGLPVVRWLMLTAKEARRAAELGDVVGRELGYPCFVKPANGGSSVGIAKVHRPGELAGALEEAAAYDERVLVEEAIAGRELECGVLGNESPEASVVGELVPGREFYDYAAKYLESGSQTVVPAALPEAVASEVRELALRAFRAVSGAGMARVDFFLEPSRGKVYVNEINTIPGFTRMSMYPKLWEASGLPLPKLVDRLIALALERHAARSTRRTHYEPPAAPAPQRSSEATLSKGRAR